MRGCSGWSTSMLLTQRCSAPGSEAAAGHGGLYLGAYAWVGESEPSPTTPDAGAASADLAAQFPGTAPLMDDPADGGYIHAPSLPHADAAAVLRSGYLANATPANPETLAVNLSSDRVRLALALLEGIRNGQSLGALLGYRFERGLHDDYTLAEVDKFIYPLRKAFPLVADALASTKTGPGRADRGDRGPQRPRRQQAGRPDHEQRHHDLSVRPGQLCRRRPPAEQAALNAEADALLDVYDAIADLALAEGVHQAVQGNYDRVASTIERLHDRQFPARARGRPDTARPASGYASRRRSFQPGLAAPPGATPRAQAEPAVDDWLEPLLPPLDQHRLHRDLDRPDHRQRRSSTRSPWPTSDLRPIDRALSPQARQRAGDDGARRPHPASRHRRPRIRGPTPTLQIQYLTAPAGAVEHLRGRPLLRELADAGHAVAPCGPPTSPLAQRRQPERQLAVFADAARIAGSARRPRRRSAATSTPSSRRSTRCWPIPSPTAPRSSRQSTHRSPGGRPARARRALRDAVIGWGFAYAWLHAAFADLLARGRALGDALERRSSPTSTTAIAAYDALPAGTSDADRFAACRLPSCSSATKLDPLAADARLGCARRSNARGAAFQRRLDRFQQRPQQPGERRSSTLFNLVGGIRTDRVRLAAVRHLAVRRPRHHCRQDISRASLTSG